MHYRRLRRLGKLDLPTFAERFWSRVDKSGGPDACWPWLGSRNPTGGHGRVYYKGKIDVASRVAWELANGPVPNGTEICHHCDNGWCCNPKCLFAGTHIENMEDMFSKGRGNRAYGARQGLAKLTDKKVVRIRAMRMTGHTAATIAERFKVTPATISKIALRRTWRHIP